MTETTTFTPAGQVEVNVPCQADAACHKPAVLLVWAYNQSDVGVDGILTCAEDVRSATKTIARRNSAVIFTTHLQEALA